MRRLENQVQRLRGQLERLNKQEGDDSSQKSTEALRRMQKQLREVRLELQEAERKEQDMARKKRSAVSGEDSYCIPLHMLQIVSQNVLKMNMLLKSLSNPPTFGTESVLISEVS